MGRAAANSIRSLYGTTFTVGTIYDVICEYFTSLSCRGLSQHNSPCPPLRARSLLEAGMPLQSDPPLGPYQT